MITFTDIAKTFPGTDDPAVQNFNATVGQGEFFVLIGPSGCGKTTTLKMINRLIEPSTGTIRIQDRDIRDWDRHELRWNVGYVLQQIALFPTMTIAENIAVVPEMRRWKKNEIKARVDELLQMVGLDPDTYRNRKPPELSGGQQQRIGVIRALAADPDIILMDEPFSALDPLSREQLQEDIRALQQNIQKTIVFVTHDMDEALALGDRICLMKDGEIVQTGTPRELKNEPANDFVRDFIGDRRDEWDTPVRAVMSGRDSQYIASVHDMPEMPLYPAPLYIFDQNDTFLGRRDGDSIASQKTVISPDHVLYDALKTFNDTDAEALPVLEEGRLVGALSYKDVMQFLQKAKLASAGGDSKA